MTFRVVLSEEAERNLQEQGDWLHSQSPNGAAAWLQAAKDAIESLRSRPLRNALAPESRFRKHEIRQQFFKTRRGRIYRILYYVEGDTVWVTHVRGPRQRPLNDSSDESG